MASPRRRGYSEAEKEQFAEQRREIVAELHQKLTDNVTRLNEGQEWQRWLSMAAKFHRYSFNNVLLITLQNPDATLVAGYRAWQALGHQVRKGESAIRVLGPVTKRVAVLDQATGVPLRDASGGVLFRRLMVGAKPVSVFDASQVDPPVPPPPQPQLLTGQAPPGLWESLAALAVGQGYRVTRGECHGANGFTDYIGREVRVRKDVDDAQAVKTLAHELGHLLLPPEAGEPQSGWCRGLREVEAESVAYMVTQAHGLDSAQYTFSYVAGWASQAATDETSVADVVANTGARVVGAVDTILSHTLTADAETALVDELAVDVGVDAAAVATATEGPVWEVVHAPVGPRVAIDQLQPPALQPGRGVPPAP